MHNKYTEYLFTLLLLILGILFIAFYIIDTFTNEKETEQILVNYECEKERKTYSQYLHTVTTTNKTYYISSKNITCNLKTKPTTNKKIKIISKRHFLLGLTQNGKEILSYEKLKGDFERDNAGTILLGLLLLVSAVWKILKVYGSPKK